MSFRLLTLHVYKAAEFCLTLGMYYLTFETYTDVKNKWEKSSWGRKFIVQKRRAALNDFDRFKVMLAKIKVSFTANYTFA